MPFEENWDYPEGRLLSEEEIRKLIEGPLGEQQRAIIAASCTSFFWHAPDSTGDRPVTTNGTLSFVQSHERTFGVTAAHVVTGYLKDADRPGTVLQLGNAAVDLELIDLNEELDLATIALPPHLERDVGKPIAPVSLPRPGDVPQEGRGIMLGGYIGSERQIVGTRAIAWGMFFACGVARRVNDRQISWAPDHAHHIPVAGIPDLAPNADLGGISGEPLIAWFEKEGGSIAWYSLAGIIVEQSALLENVVATRCEYIRPDGRLIAP